MPSGQGQAGHGAAHCRPSAPPPRAPSRGPVLSLASSRLAALVSAVYQFSASLRMGELGGAVVRGGTALPGMLSRLPALLSPWPYPAQWDLSPSLLAPAPLCTHLLSPQGQARPRALDTVRALVCE